MNGTFLGIDLGTSSVKTLLIDTVGETVAQASRKYEIEHPHDGWGQIDPQIWYDAMAGCLDEIFASCDAGSVKAIGITGQMHTLVTLRSDGTSLRPAIMWNDARTKEMLPELKKTLAGYPEGDYLSRTISIGSPAANLYWMKKEEPELLSQLAHFCIGPDYLVYRLTGIVGTDYCEASTSCLYRLQEMRWSDEIRELIGIGEDVYPTIRASATVVGNVLPEMCSRFGFGENVPVVAGTGDNAATAVSTGCMALKYPVLSLGTSGVLMFPVEHLNQVGKGKVIQFAAEEGKSSWLVQGAVQSNGDAINWMSEEIFALDASQNRPESADRKKSAASGLLFYPHLGGEKTIYADPNLRGAFFGIAPDASRDDMYCALLEGLSFAYRELASEMKLDLTQYESLKIVGGGARSDMWLQTLADVLNIRTERTAGAAGPAYGVAMLARCGADSTHTFEQIAHGNLKTEKVFEPNPEMAQLYNMKYQKYLRIHDAVKSVQGE